MAITTNNYKLTQLELTNVANFPLLLNNTFKTIDKGLTLDVGNSTGTGNNYVLNLGSITLTSANKGISFKFWADKNSTGAVTINGTYNLVKANGNPVKNIKRNAPYVITYNGGTNFFLSSGGADESDSTTVGIDGSKVLAPETFIGSDGEIHTGTIPTRTAVNTTLKAGQSVTLDSGYYKDKSTIKAETLATAMTNAGVTLTSANQLIKDVKAVDKTGKLITGTATIRSLGGVPFHKTVGKAHFEVDSGSYHMFHPQINFDYDVLEGYWYHTDMGDTNDSRHYFYINKRYWSTSDMYLLSALPYGKSKTNSDDNNPPSGSMSGGSGIRRRLCSNTTGINTYQLLNNPKISSFTYSSNPNLDITVISFAYKI